MFVRFVTFAVCALSISLAAAVTRSAPPDVDAAIEVARRAHEARTAGRFADFAALHLDQELEDVKSSFVAMWKEAIAAGRPEPFAQALPSVASPEELEAMDAEQLFAILAEQKAAILRKTLKQPDVFKVLGSAIDGDVVYLVVARPYNGLAMYPFFATEEGAVRMGLHVDERTRIRTHRKVAALKQEGATPEEIERKLAPSGFAKIDVLTLVSDGSMTWILGRATAKFDDREESAIGLFPIGGRSPLIELLDEENPTALDDERRASLEAGLMKEVERARAARGPK